MSITPNWKPSRTARRKETIKARRERTRSLKDNKRDSKIRDLYRCRFPHCRCRRFHLPLESAHWAHAGMGGDHGRRASTANLVTLCSCRHRDGQYSVDRAGIRPVFLSDQGYDGPIAWEVRWQAGDWVQVAHETAIQQWEYDRGDILAVLADMED